MKIEFFIQTMYNKQEERLQIMMRRLKVENQSIKENQRKHHYTPG